MKPRRKSRRVFNYIWSLALFDACTYINLTLGKSVHHHTIQIIQRTRSNSFTSLLLDVYVWLNMFRASPRPSSGRGLARTRPTTLQPLLSNGKTRGS